MSIKKSFNLISVAICLVLTSAIISSGIPFISAESDSHENTITIYHTNDMHGNISSIYSSGELVQIGLDYVKSIKDSTKNSILIDAGDATQGTPFGKFTKGQDIIKLMNKVGYDCMTVGNHEFDYGAEAVVSIAKSASFPVISANTFYNGENMFAGINGYNGCNYIKEINGKKIGFFGITTPETMKTTIPQNLEGVLFKDEIETSREQVKYLKQQGADVIVGITHVGIESSSTVKSYDIANAIDDLDIIIDGHSHSVKTEIVAGTLIQQTGTESHNVGKLTINFSGDDFSIDSELLNSDQIGRDYKPDQGVSDLYNELYSNIAPKLEKVVGATYATLYGGNYSSKNISRIVETNLGDLIGDSMMYESANLLKETEYKDMPVVAMENGGAVRSRINPGFITMEDILKVLPLDNRLSLQIITPKTLYQTLERGVCKMKAPNASGEPLDGFFGGFPQIAGMKIEFDITKEAYDTNTPREYKGERVQKVTLISQENDKNNNIVLDRNDDETKLIFACNDYTITEYPMVDEVDVLMKGDYLSNTLANYINKLTLDLGEPMYAYDVNDRVVLLNQEEYQSNFDSKIQIMYDSALLSYSDIKVSVDNKKEIDITTDGQGYFTINNLDYDGHTIRVCYNNKYADAYVDPRAGIKDASIIINGSSDKNIKCTINLIDQIPEEVTRDEAGLIKFARVSYNALSNDDRLSVTNYNKLVNAEKELLNRPNMMTIVRDIILKDPVMDIVIIIVTSTFIAGLIIVLVKKHNKVK